MENVKSYLDAQSKSELRDGMRIDWDVPIEMNDGLSCAATFTVQSRKAITRLL